MFSKNDTKIVVLVLILKHTKVDYFICKRHVLDSFLSKYLNEYFIRIF